MSGERGPPPSPCFGPPVPVRPAFEYALALTKRYGKSSESQDSRGRDFNKPNHLGGASSAGSRLPSDSPGFGCVLASPALRCKNFWNEVSRSLRGFFSTSCRCIRPNTAAFLGARRNAHAGKENR